MQLRLDTLRLKSTPVGAFLVNVAFLRSVVAVHMVHVWYTRWEMCPRWKQQLEAIQQQQYLVPASSVCLRSGNTGGPCYVPEAH